MSTHDFYTVAHETLQCIFHSVEVAQLACARIQATKAVDAPTNEAEAELESVIHGLKRLMDRFEARLDSEIGNTPTAMQMKTTMSGIRDILEHMRPSAELQDLCASLEQLMVEKNVGESEPTENTER